MRNLKALALLAVAMVLSAWPAASQMTMRTPELRGVFNPVVGAGASYKSDANNASSDMEISLVGKEDVNGKTGYWVEMAMAQRSEGRLYLKYLMVVNGDTTTIARSIMQMPGQPPMETTSMMNRGAAAMKQSIDSRKESQLVGSESVTTPAGTFNCEHYKAKDGSWDAWMAPNVGPWGLVKSVDNNSNSKTTMVVTRVFSNATDHITGTPQQMDMQQMMQQMMRQRQGQ